MELTAVKTAHEPMPLPPQLGDRHDLTQLMQSHGRMIYGLALKLVRNEDVAQDLTQEVFLHALERRDQYDEAQGTVSQWLAGIARYRALDYLKSAETKRCGALTVPDLQGSDDLEGSLVFSDQLRVIQTAVGQLNDPQKEVIRLAFYEGLSHADIADRLQEPLGTVKGRMRAAIRKLRFVLVEEA